MQRKNKRILLKIVFIFLLNIPLLLSGITFQEIFREYDFDLNKSNKFIIGAYVSAQSHWKEETLYCAIEYDLSKIFPKLEIEKALKEIQFLDTAREIHSKLPKSAIIIFYVSNNSSDIELHFFDIYNSKNLGNVELGKMPKLAKPCLEVSNYIKVSSEFLKSTTPYLNEEIFKYLDFSNKREWSLYVIGDKVYSYFNGPWGHDGGAILLVQEGATGRILELRQER